MNSLLFFRILNFMATEMKFDDLVFRLENITKARREITVKNR